MQSLDLIADVALSRLRELFSPAGRARPKVLLVDLGPEISSRIAIKARATLSELDIHLPHALADASAQDLVSDTPLVDLRHQRVPGDKRGRLFAATRIEYDLYRASMRNVIRLDDQTLREHRVAWLEAAGLNDLSDEMQASLTALFEIASPFAPQLSNFAEFVLQLHEQRRSGRHGDLEQIVSASLPTIRIPEGALAVKSANRNGPPTTTDWRKAFRAVEQDAQRYLFRTDKKKEPIPPATLAAKLDELARDDPATYGPSTPLHAALDSFIHDTGILRNDWRASQQALLAFPWEQLQPLFEDVDRSQRKTLGEETLEHFDDRGEHLDDDTRGQLLQVKTKMKQDDTAFRFAEDFYYTYKDIIARNNAALLRKWQNLVLKQPRVFDNVLSGVADTAGRLIQMHDGADLTDHVFLLRLPGAQDIDFWKNGHDPHLSRYIAWRYHGLDRALEGPVVCQLGRLQSHALATHGAHGENERKKRSAREFRFELALLPRGEAGSTDPDAAKGRSAHFIVEPPLRALATALADDLQKIANLSAARAHLWSTPIRRESAHFAGNVTRLDVADKATVRDAGNGNDGTLLDLNHPEGDIRSTFFAGLDGLVADGRLTRTDHDAIAAAFEVFHDSYSRAIRDWCDPKGLGVASPAWLEQAEDYGRLIETLITRTDRDALRQRLWRPLARLGTSAVAEGGRAMIIAPWHPLRLAEMAAKQQQLRRVLAGVLAHDADYARNAETFFRQLAGDLATTYYPEVGVIERPEGLSLLAETAAVLGYGLLEPPVRGHNGEEAEDQDVLDSSAAEAAQHFAEVGDRYLDLMPHEQANFSVVLYNADSKALPTAVADRFADSVDRNAELRCDLFLSHDDPRHTRRIYEQQNAAIAEHEDDNPVLSSEAASNFLSRLRVGCLTAPREGDGTAHEHDLVLMQDVIARAAELRWIELEPPAVEPALADFSPATWSRRHPADENDLKAAVYLTSPVLPRVARAYLALMHGLAAGEASARFQIPARVVNFGHEPLRRMITTTHRLGEWVVNYDAIADRRLLQSAEIDIIRHVRERGSNRTLLVSTQATPFFVYHQLRAIVSDILGGEHQAERRGIDPDALVRTLVKEANGISGGLVMRATRDDDACRELLGIVLAMRDIRARLAAESVGRGLCWYFLDDYARWFDKKAGTVADIIALAPTITAGERRLRVVISESKFVTDSAQSGAANKSHTQLRTTMHALEQALNPDEERVDRELYLSRLADLLLEGTSHFEDDGDPPYSLLDWSREVRDGRLPLELLGLSHIFLHDARDVPTPARRLDEIRGRQLFFHRDDIARLLRHDDGVSTEAPDEAWHDALLTNRRAAALADRAASHPAPAAGDGRAKPGPVGNEHTAATGQATAPLADAPDGACGVADAARRSPAADRPTGAAADAAPAPIDPGTPPPSRGRSNAGEMTPPVRAWLDAQAGEADDTEIRRWMEAEVQRLRTALLDFQMTQEVRETRLTPNAALVRMKGSPSLTRHNVDRRRDELESTYGLRLLNVRQAPREILISLQRPDRDDGTPKLTLAQAWRQRALPKTAPKENGHLLLGIRESDGRPVYLNLAGGFAGQPEHAPHTLIAGMTGGGKGVLIQNLLLDICATNSPDAAHVYIIDPKGLDFTWMEALPHLQGEIAANQQDAATMLEALVATMHARLELFRAHPGVTKLAHYNARVDAADRLPRIFLFHDEYATWGQTKEYRELTENRINELGQMARAAGIHVFLITQRPERSVMPLQARENLGNRLSLHVANANNADLVGVPGADKLLLGGHLGAMLPGETQTGGDGVIEVQVPFVGADDIDALTRHIAESWRAWRLAEAEPADA